ncbi:unnamed protein product, partial [Discosporangium mesarthrocarpum]
GAAADEAQLRAAAGADLWQELGLETGAGETEMGAGTGAGEASNERKTGENETGMMAGGGAEPWQEPGSGTGVGAGADETKMETGSEAHSWQQPGLGTGAAPVAVDMMTGADKTKARSGAGTALDKRKTRANETERVAGAGAGSWQESGSGAGRGAEAGGGTTGDGIRRLKAGKEEDELLEPRESTGRPRPLPRSPLKLISPLRVMSPKRLLREAPPRLSGEVGWGREGKVDRRWVRVRGARRSLSFGRRRHPGSEGEASTPRGGHVLPGVGRCLLPFTSWRSGGEKDKATSGGEEKKGAVARGVELPGDGAGG